MPYDYSPPRLSRAMDAASVAKMTVPQLRAALEERGLDAKGLNAALVARLLEALDAPGDAPQVRYALRHAAAPAACFSPLGRTLLTPRLCNQP